MPGHRSGRERRRRPQMLPGCQNFDLGFWYYSVRNVLASAFAVFPFDYRRILRHGARRSPRIVWMTSSDRKRLVAWSWPTAPSLNAPLALLITKRRARPAEPSLNAALSFRWAAPMSALGQKLTTSRVLLLVGFVPKQTSCLSRQWPAPNPGTQYPKKRCSSPNTLWRRATKCASIPGGKGGRIASLPIFVCR
jgi:hypothetical protein